MLSGVAVALSLLLLGGLANLAVYRAEVGEWQALAQLRANNAAEALREALEQAEDAALTLALMPLDEITTQEEFERRLNGFRGNVGRGVVLQWAPGAVVRFSHPLAGNAAIIGTDLRSLANARDDVRWAIESKQGLWSPPIRLKQGGIGMAYRQPIFGAGAAGSAGPFRGIVTALVQPLQLLERLQANSPQFRIGLSLVGPGGESQVLAAAPPPGSVALAVVEHPLGVPAPVAQLAQPRAVAGLPFSPPPAAGPANFRVVATAAPKEAHLPPLGRRLTAWLVLAVLAGWLSAVLVARRQTVRELQAANAAFGAVWESSKDAMVLVFPPDWKLQRANPAAVALFAARDVAHLATLGPADLLAAPPDSDKAARLTQGLERALGEGTAEFDCSMRRLDGKDFPGEVLLARISIDGVVGLQLTIRDMSAREAAKVTLARVRDTLLLAQEVGGVGSFEYFPATRAHEWSAGQKHIYGLDPDGPTPQIGEVIGMVHPDDRQRMLANWQAFLQGRMPGAWEYRIVRSDGSVRWLEDRLLRQVDARGNVERVVGASLDVTEHRLAEQAQAQLLAERTTLLDEVHHRVKNNLQVVASLLNMQQQAAHPDVAAGLQVARDRIGAIAMVHEQLYRSEAFDRIDFAPYLRELCRSLSRANGAEGRGIGFEVLGPGFALSLQEAVPCGLLAAELIGNAFKHGFPGGRRGKLTVVAELAAGARVLRVEDDGVGMPADGEVAGKPGSPLPVTRMLLGGVGSRERPGSLGLKLVERLAKQLKGQLECDAGAGLRWRLRLPAEERREGEDGN